ncbi:MAG: S1C family serine protease [Eubacteriales bacterium]
MNNFNQDDNDTNNENNSIPEEPNNGQQSPAAGTEMRNEYERPIYHVNKKKPKQKKGISRGFVAVAVIVCILFSGAAGFGGTYLASEFLNQSETSQSAANNPSDSKSGNEGGVIFKSTASVANTAKIESNVIASVASKAAATVVEISTETMVTSSFYGQYITGGAGSGVIITENGYIITCAHVVSGAENITVKMTDGMEYPATLIGSDTLTDIAVVKIDVTGLPYAIMGDSSNLVVGEDAIAIGNPLGELGGTVTNGIISALDREVEIDGQKYNLLQTNAAINPGNSGGGLFNVNAELIGVVNAKSSGSGIEGLGFAIPINDAISVAQQLINYGFIKGRPQLGIYVLDVNASTDYWTLRSQEYAAIINYITDYGVYFLNYNTDIQTEGDFKFGDRIVAIDGVAVSNKQALAKILNEEYKVGDTATITVARLTDTKSQRSEMLDLTITLIESVPASAQSPGETQIKP